MAEIVGAEAGERIEVLMQCDSSHHHSKIDTLRFMNQSLTFCNHFCSRDDMVKNVITNLSFLYLFLLLFHEFSSSPAEHKIREIS